MGRALPTRRDLEHALLLIVRQHGGSDATAAAASAELERWRQADPAHERAYRAAWRSWEASEAAGLREEVALPAHHPEKRRRQALAGLAVAALLFVLGGAGRWYWQLPLHEEVLATGRGQMRTVRLPDGSELDLDARTRATVAYYRDRREVRLEGGEIRCRVQADSGRPFTVFTDWGRARVLGTVFSVAARYGRMRVAVAEGRVGVAGNEPAAAAIELVAGQTVQADAGGPGPVGAIRPGDVAAWREGWLVFDDTPLGEAVARWNEYRPAPLTLADDPSLRHLRLTGSFALRDADAFVASLPHILPVAVARHGEGRLEIRARH